MSLLRDLRRRGAVVLAPLVAVAALLAACGGGTSQVEAFVPERLLVLGDEASMLVDDGAGDGFKYGINDRRGTTNGKCLLLPTIVQQLATHYGLVFAACNPKAVEAKAFILAQAGAQVDAAANGLAAQVAAISGLGKSDMVTLLIGSNDLIAIYEQKRAGALTAAQAVAEAVRRGGLVAAQVNAVLGTGARAMVITVPDMGKSPYALQANVGDPGSTGNPGAAALLTTLTTEYNAALRLGIDSTDYDGRNYGLVLADDVLATMVRYPSSFLASPANVKDAACIATTPAAACQLTTDTENTLVDAALDNANSYLWATDRQLGPVAHLQIGAQAVSRAIDNPF